MPYILPLFDDFHDRLAHGRGLHLDMWRYLFEVLVQPRFQNVIFWRDSHQPHQLADGQKSYRLKSQRTGREGGKSCWTIQEFEGGSFTVKEYRLRTTYGDALDQVEETLKGIPTWKMQVNVHQVSLRYCAMTYETPLNFPDRVPFEDAIVFDMLLDLVTNNFEPHTKIIEDGPGLQLEILQLLEKANQEAVEAADRASGKRRLSMQERLDGKRKKQN
ncbi:hypothetical protein PMIN01_02072 [Paraphaeosphaeria minitans]|uniref:Uncharacterized protein n=1 Tax=Paraphaeosphaeria minitans TaxID=565426 RepID=A0A9P6GQL2_9PLEO|nr:hypothetical protein PMIN01_02072 [Paraphaeosphaeria minitans]